MRTTPPSRDGGVLFVDALHPGGGALEAGLRVGDELLAVEEVPALSVPYEALLTRIKGPRGTTVKLTLRRAGNVYVVRVQRRRLVW